jgi:hypothetical protein
VTKLLIIDAANVVGSRPDGWWRDRAGATARLRDSVADLADEFDVVLVVEGKARSVPAISGVRVVASPGTGDDTIVDLVREAGGAATAVTADRLLRERVTALGGRVVGPSTLREWLARRS